MASDRFFLCAAIEQYERHAILGEGTFGRVVLYNINGASIPNNVQKYISKKTSNFRSCEIFLFIKSNQIYLDCDIKYVGNYIYSRATSSLGKN